MRTRADFKGFLADQVEAVGALRDERSDNSAVRVDACCLAMAYLGAFQPGIHSTHKVIETSRVFERYLLEL